MNNPGLCFTGLILFFLLISYIFYRFYAIFSLNTSPTINRILKPVIKDNYAILGDGARVQSQILNADSKTDSIFFVVHSLNTKKEDFRQLATADPTQKHVTFLWTLRNFAPNLIDNKYQIGTLTNDISDLVQALRDKYPTKKLIFVGDGFGAMLLTSFMYRYPGTNESSKFILINPIANQDTSAFSYFQSSSQNWLNYFIGIFSYRKIPMKMNVHFNPTADQVTFTKTVPLYFFGNFYVLSKYVIKNILGNKRSEIFITYDENDKKSSYVLLSYKSRFEVTNPNIRFKINPHLESSLPKSDQKRSQFFTSLLKDFSHKNPF